MFATYDMCKFSEELKNLRISMGFTIDNVCMKTGISRSTIKMIEKGTSVPKFETLQILSHFYKTDLILALNKYKNLWQLTSLYEKLNQYIANGDSELLKIALKEINDLMQTNEFSPVVHNEFIQLRYYFKGLEIALDCSEETLELINQAIDELCSALKVTNSGFEVEAFHEYKYNAVEYKILFSLASMLGIQRQCELSNRILFHIIQYLDFSSQVERNDIVLKSKALATIAYNYHRIDDHEKVIEYATIGIEFSIKNDTYQYLPLLLARKGTALFNLNRENWNDYFIQALNLLELQGKDELRSDYERLFNKLQK